MRAFMCRLVWSFTYTQDTGYTIIFPKYHNILLSYHIFICLWHQLCVTQISCFQFLYIESCLGVTECLLFAKWIRVKTSMFGLYHSDQCPTLLSDYSNQEKIIHTCFCVCNNIINVFIYFLIKKIS